MSEIDANIIVDGQKTVATIPQEGEIVQDGGEIDATCIVEDSNGKRHKAVKIVNIDDEPSDKSEIDAQILNNNNELITVTEEQDGEIIPQDNSEIDFHCLVQKDAGKQLSVKTVELNGEIIKLGGAIDATCVVNAEGKKQLALKVFKKGSASGGTYYAYKDGSNNIIYTKDSTASIDYTLENLTNTNCTDLGDGVYQGGANKYFVTNSTPALATANSWEFKTKVKYVPTNGSSCIFGCSANDCQTPIFGHIINNQIYALLSSNGSSWDLYSTVIKDIDTQETLTLSTNTTYYFKLGFTGTEYYLWYSTVGFDDTGKTLTFLRTSTKVYCADPLMFLNNNFGLSGYYWGGTIDLTRTSLVIDGVETSFCEVTKSTLYNSSLQPMTVQPDYILGKGIEVTNMQNGALILPTQQPVSSMELCVHYKTNSSFPNVQLTGGADETTHSGIYFQNYDSYLNTWISSNGSSYDIASDANIASGFVNDTEYWLKATWDGTKYEFYTSTDGINFVKSYRVINSTSPVFWNNSNLYLGNNAAKSFTQVYAKYFLEGTYLKVDGATVFDGSLGTGYTTDGCTVSGFIKGDIKFNNTVYGRSPSDDRQA